MRHPEQTILFRLPDMIRTLEFYRPPHLLQFKRLPTGAWSAILYPNPAHEFFKLQKALGYSVKRICIYDLHSRWLIDIRVEAKGDETIDLRMQKAGVYVIKISATNRIYSIKLLKEQMYAELKK